MVVLGIRGKLSYLKFLTDKGVFKGSGELLANGFCVYRSTIKDETESPISTDLREELMRAVAIYTDKECPTFHVTFE